MGVGDVHGHRNSLKVGRREIDVGNAVAGLGNQEEPLEPMK
jgi:hypothetical protein